MWNVRPPVFRFIRDTRGTMPERWAMIVGGVAVFCVFGTHMFDQAMRHGVVTQFVQSNSRDLAEASRKSPLSTLTTRQQTAAGIDYTATASIAGSNEVHLDPCTGRIK